LPNKKSKTIIKMEFLLLLEGRLLKMYYLLIFFT